MHVTSRVYVYWVVAIDRVTVTERCSMPKFALILAALVAVPALSYANREPPGDVPTCGEFAETMFYGHEAPADRAYWAALAKDAGATKPNLPQLFWDCTETPAVPFRQMVRERFWVQRDMKPGE
jgi:hypothetical protein